MAAQSKPAASATAPAAAASSPTSTAPTAPAATQLELQPATIDVEDLLASEEPAAAGTEEPQETETASAEEESAGESETGASEAAGHDESTEPQETSAQTDPAENAETDEALDQAVRSALKPKAVKRFDAVLTQRNEALARVRALETQLAEQPNAPVPVKIASDPLAGVTNEEQLEAETARFKAVQRWCRSHPTGGMPPAELTGAPDLEFSAEDVAFNLERAETILEAAPKRAQFLKEFAAQRAQTRAAHPAMFTAGTPENAAAKAWQRKLLQFHQAPDQDQIIATLIQAEQAQREERDGIARRVRVEIKKPAPASAEQGAADKPKPKPAAQPARTPMVRPAATQGQDAWEKVNAPGGSVDVEELLEAKA